MRVARAEQVLGQTLEAAGKGCGERAAQASTHQGTPLALGRIGQLTLESQPAWVTQRGWLGEIINMRTPLQLTTKFFS